MADPKATPAKTADKPKTDAPAAPAKSIIDAKYRDGRYKEQDWLGGLIGSVATSTKEVQKTVVDGDEKKTTTETVPDGVNVDALFALAKENNLDVAKFEAQREGHGFPGRFRMTVRNMLQAAAKKRHGIRVNGKFVEAPADWLASKDAPEKPTHTQDGTKIVIPKPVKETAPKEDKAGGEASAKKADAKPAVKDAPKK